MLDPDISTQQALAHLSRDEHDPNVLDRRRFLQLVGMGLGAGALAGPTSSLLDTVLGQNPGAAFAAGPIGANDGILVVLGMFGGNDGLNTTIPFNDGNYYEQHGNLAVPASQTLSIDGDIGLNPALTEFKRFWDDGKLAIVEGVGYPNPDLSHFNSMGYWMAGRPNAIPTSGWLGRWLDGHLGSRQDLYAGVEVGHSLPLHLVGLQHRGTVVPPGKPAFGAGTAARDLLDVRGRPSHANRIERRLVPQRFTGVHRSARSGLHARTRHPRDPARHQHRGPPRSDRTTREREPRVQGAHSRVR